MKLSQFFAMLFGQKVDTANNALKAISTEADKKNISGVMTNVGVVVGEAAKIVEEASETLKALTGGGIAGEEKHALVKTAVLEAVAPTAEKVLPTPPGTSQDVWGGFLRSLLGSTISILINVFVAKANEKNWKF